MSVRSRILGPPVPKMPSGLIELMDGLARDVLKNNPENVYEFCARHMQTLLEIRDGRALKPLITLDQKIEKAQKKVKQRAEERQRAYDKEIAEDNINQQADLSATITSHDGDDFESSVKMETNNVSIEIQPGGKEEITKVIESEVFEKSGVITEEIKDEKNDKYVDLHNVDQGEMEGNKDIENKSNQEVVNVVDTDLSVLTGKTSLLIEDEHNTDDINADNGTISNMEINISKEIQSIVVTTDDTKEDNDVPEPLSNDAAKKLESIDNTETEVMSPEDNGIHSHNQRTEIVKNDNATEIQNEVETSVKDTSVEILPTVTIEETVLASDNVNDNSYFAVETEPVEERIDAPSKNISLNENCTETFLNNKDDLPNKEAESLNESEKSQDVQILSVILDSNNAESASLQNDEPDTVQPNEITSLDIIVTESAEIELEQKPNQNMDFESGSESAHDNDKTNNINSSMDLETAAITIQKVFRSFLFKTKTASYDDPTTVDITLLTEDKETEETELLNIKDRRPLGISRMDTVLQTVNEEKSLSLSTDDSSTLSSAATIIQAHVRGYLVRNKLNLNKTISSNSLMDSDAPSIPSLEADSDNIKSKTVLNIHIVPEGGHFVSRDESIFTSMDLSLDSSPPSSVNLHPLGYDKSERRKQLKIEDAIQSVSPPSNNSGKLSEEHDSVKEILTGESNVETEQAVLNDKTNDEAPEILDKKEDKVVAENGLYVETLTSDAASDEMDVITPFVEDKSARESDNSTKLLHSGEFHDIVVPTNVTRSDTSVVRGE